MCGGSNTTQVKLISLWKRICVLCCVVLCCVSECVSSLRAKCYMEDSSITHVHTVHVYCLSD